MAPQPVRNEIRSASLRLTQSCEYIQPFGRRNPHDIRYLQSVLLIIPGAVRHRARDILGIPPYDPGVLLA